MPSLGQFFSQKILLTIGARRPFTHSAMARRVELSSELSRMCDNSVLSGPFKGMRLPDTSSLGDADRAPKLLGTYEENLHGSLAKAVARVPSLVINVGCAEGYFAVGLARLLPDATVHAFDIDGVAAALCHETAKINGVSDRVTICTSYRAAMLDHLIKNHARVLIFMDCEGAEVDLLDPSLSRRLAECDIIVETHDATSPNIDATSPNIRDTLEKRLSASHFVDRIPHGGRDPNRFPELHSWPEMDRWLVVSEERPQGMTWLACFTRDHANIGTSEP
jgi:predicted O-methyltransferase YrrM